MKRRKFRWLCGLMALLTVMIVALPHHHHGHRFCAVVEVCEQDQAANDHHTGHHDDGDRHACQLQPLAVEKASAQHASFYFVPLALQGERVCLAAPMVWAVRLYNIYNVRARALCCLAVKSLRAPPFASFS